MWQRREIENYLCQENVLLAYARDDHAKIEHREQIMHETIAEVAMALKTLGKPDPWSADIKASDDFLKPLFNRYFEKLGLQNFMYKTNYHVLARLVPKEKIDHEIIEKLDSIVAVAETATPR